MSLKVYYSVVSHANEKDIKNNFSWDLNKNEKFIIRENIILNRDLENFCELNDFIYFSNEKPQGYGENHNRNFESIEDDDFWFVVLNPDVIFNRSSVPFSALEKGCAYGGQIFNDKLFKISDSHNRSFPKLSDLVVSYFTGRKRYLSENKDSVDWIGGSFMIWHSSDYRLLRGFDKNYFMYMEDVDICRRFKNIGGQIKLLQVKVYHKAMRRKSLRHLMWKLKSMFYYFRKYGI